MRGTIAIADYGWYEKLRDLSPIDEVNFWKPSAARAFHAEEFSPFLFKLKAPHNAICGFGYFARYFVLPDWLAWECFERGNGCDSLAEMQERIGRIRERIRFRGPPTSPDIGCILIVQPVFFPPDRWVSAPRDWPVRTQTEKKYDLGSGEGARVWQECLAVALDVRGERLPADVQVGAEPGPRYGRPVLVAPRWGQGTFRAAVTEAYERGCAVTGEHSLPALEAAHIRRYADGGPHELSNGLLLRADLHRLFDKGYLTVTPDLRLEVSRSLREDFSNGRSYYPFQGRAVRCPRLTRDNPSPRHLDWHRENVFRG